MKTEIEQAQAYLTGREAQKAARKAVAAAKALLERATATIAAGAEKYRSGSQLMVDAISLEESLDGPSVLARDAKVIQAKVAALRKQGRVMRAQGLAEQTAGRGLAREAERARKAAVRGLSDADSQVHAGSGARKRKVDLGMGGLLDYPGDEA